MKKILSLILALTFIITTFAFVGTTVYADTSLIYDMNFAVGADKNDTGTYYGRVMFCISQEQLTKLLFLVSN